MAFYRIIDGRAEVKVRVIPNAKTENIIGLELRDDGNQYLKIKTRAIPEDGKANEAIIKILAKALKIPKSNITLITGATSRSKIFCLRGIDEGAISALIAP